MTDFVKTEHGQKVINLLKELEALAKNENNLWKLLNIRVSECLLAKRINNNTYKKCLSETVKLFYKCVYDKRYEIKVIHYMDVILRSGVGFCPFNNQLTAELYFCDYENTWIDILISIIEVLLKDYRVPGRKELTVNYKYEHRYFFDVYVYKDTEVLVRSIIGMEMFVDRLINYLRKMSDNKFDFEDFRWYMITSVDAFVESSASGDEELNKQFIELPQYASNEVPLYSRADKRPLNFKVIYRLK